MPMISFQQLDITYYYDIFISHVIVQWYVECQMFSASLPKVQMYVPQILPAASIVTRINTYDGSVSINIMPPPNVAKYIRRLPSKVAQISTCSFIDYEWYFIIPATMLDFWYLNSIDGINRYEKCKKPTRFRCRRWFSWISDMDWLGINA